MKWLAYAIIGVFVAGLTAMMGFMQYEAWSADPWVPIIADGMTAFIYAITWAITYLNREEVRA